METTMFLSALIFLLLRLGDQPHTDPTECYVPVCGAEPYTLLEVFITLDLSSGKWTTSWASNDVRRPESICTCDQVATVLQGFYSSDSPCRMRAGNELGGGYSTCVTGLQLLQMYLNAFITWVVDLMPEDGLLLSNLSLWLMPISIMAKQVLQILNLLAIEWLWISTLVYLVLRTIEIQIYIARIFYRIGLRVIALFCWIWGCLHQGGTRAAEPQALLEEDVNLEQEEAP